MLQHSRPTRRIRVQVVLFSAAGSFLHVSELIFERRASGTIPAPLPSIRMVSHTTTRAGGRHLTLTTDGQISITRPVPPPVILPEVGMGTASMLAPETRNAACASGGTSRGETRPSIIMR